MKIGTIATVIANTTSEGLSVMGIDFYITRRQLHVMAPRRFVNELNAIPLLDREKVQSAIMQKYGITRDNIQFQ